MQRVRLFVLDDDPFEHTMLKRTAKRMEASVEFFFAQTEEELRRTLPHANPHLVLCDNRVPPYADYGDLVPLIRRVGYKGAIVVMSSLLEATDHAEMARSGVVDMRSKGELSAPVLDQLIKAHAADVTMNC